MKRSTAVLKSIMLVIIISAFTNVSVGQTPTYKLYFTNVSATPNAVSWDVYLLRTGTTPLQLAAIQFGFGYDISILNGGTVTAAILPGSDLPTAMQPTTIQSGAVNYTAAPVPAGQTHRYINIAARPVPGAGNGPLISNISSGCSAPGTKICRVQLINSVNWAPGSQMNQVFSNAVGSQMTKTQVNAYIGTLNTIITDNSNHLSYNSSETCDPNLPLNAGNCTFTATAVTTQASCVSAGAVAITLTGVNAAAQGSYIIDAGAPQSFTGNPFSITGLAAGNHVINISSSAGCISNTISVNTAPPSVITASYNTTPTSVCASVDSHTGSITLTPSGGVAPYSYSWSGPFGFNGGSTATITGLVFGSYSVVISDANSCVAVISNIRVSSTASLNGDVTGVRTRICNNIDFHNGSLTVIPSGGLPPYSYSWSGPNGFTAGNISTISGLTAGFYNVIITDAIGCTRNITNIELLSANYLVVNTNGSVLNSCGNSGLINLQGIGGQTPYSYSITGTNYQASNIFNNLAPGIYTCYIKDVNGCIGSKNLTINLSAVSVTARHTNASTCISNGTIQANDPSGGVAPFTYSIDGIAFQTGKSFAGLAAGTYTLTAKDVYGCTGTTSVTITQNPINVTSYAWNASNCTTANGQIRLFLTGGVSPYSYSLDGNTYQSSPVFSGLSSGTYAGYVKDGQNCVGMNTNIVIGPSGCTPGFTANNTTTRQITAAEKNIALNVQAYPNPSEDEFTIVLEGYDNKQKVLITVTDVLGRNVYQKETTGKSQYTFGKDLKTGIYIVQVIQGNEKKSLKIIKE